MELVVQILLFVFAVFVCFYIPGGLFIRAFAWEVPEIAIFPIRLAVGLVLFVAIDYICSLLGVRQGIYVYLFVVNILAYIKRISVIDFCFYAKTTKLLLVGLLLVALPFSVTMLRSGWADGNGLSYVGVNGSDGIWHIALINEMTHTFPPEHPGLAGIPLTGYHFTYDFLLAEFQRLFHISSLHLLFHFFPVVISFLWSAFVYCILIRLFQNRRMAWIGVVLALYGGSFAFVVPLLWGHSISLDDGLGITQPYTSLVNPQYASSVLLVLLSLYCIDMYIRQKRVSLLVFIGIVAAISMGFKAYAGMILLGSFLVFCVIVSVKTRNIWTLCIGAAAVLLAWVLFGASSSAYGFLVYQPFWPPHRVMQSTLDFTQWELKRQTLAAMGSGKGLLKLEVVAFVIFVFGNLGIRNVGFVYLQRMARDLYRSKRAWFILYFLLCLGISFGVPMFFIQPTAGPFNMIQMYWYFLLLFSFVGAYGIESLISVVQKRHMFFSFCLLSLLALLLVPSLYYQMKWYLVGKTDYIRADYLAALTSVSSLGTYGETLLEVPRLTYYTKDLVNGWFVGVSDPFVPALAHKRAYLNEETVSFPYEDKERRVDVISLFMRPYISCQVEPSAACALDIAQSRHLLVDEQIRYILIDARHMWVTQMSSVRLKFANASYQMYEVLSL